jgi:prevent-host-death family protein
VQTVNIHEAKTHLSRLLARVEKGETVLISRAGKPVATLARYEAPGAPPMRRVGFMRGQIRVPDDFDTMGEDIIAAAFGESQGAP